MKNTQSPTKAQYINAIEIRMDWIYAARGHDSLIVKRAEKCAAKRIAALLA